MGHLPQVESNTRRAPTAGYDRPPPPPPPPPSPTHTPPPPRGQNLRDNRCTHRRPTNAAAPVLRSSEGEAPCPAPARRAEAPPVSQRDEPAELDKCRFLRDRNPGRAGAQVAKGRHRALDGRDRRSARGASQHRCNSTDARARAPDTKRSLAGSADGGANLHRRAARRPMRRIASFSSARPLVIGRELPNPTSTAARRSTQLADGDATVNRNPPPSRTPPRPFRPDRARPASERADRANRSCDAKVRRDS
jgi:hypothetical protein